MNIKKVLLSLSLLLITGSIFAQNKTVVFFAETFDDISPKVIKKIGSSDKFCLAVSFDEDKYIKKEIQDLINTHKIEPMLNVSEPYFPLIASEINISSSLVFNKVNNCKEFLENYKKLHRTTFARNKHGLYLKGCALNNETLNMFYKCNILWTMAKSEDENQKGLFIKDGVALFVPYTNFTTNETKIKQWFNSIENVKVIPIILTSTHIKNENLMISIINFINKNNFDTKLPINAAFYEYNSKTIKEDILLKQLSSVPKENILKLYLVDKEITEYANINKDEEIYTILCDEFSNMYSYNVINGIITGNKNSIKLFDISYTNIFRMLNKKSPNIDEFQEVFTAQDISETDKTNTVCKFIKENDVMMINNERIEFTSFSVYKNNGIIYLKTDTDLSLLDSIDIYIDMNSIAYTGSQKMLNPIDAFFIPEHSWEYAIRITKENIYIYKYLADVADLVETIQNKNGNAEIKVSETILRGNPYNWNYQVVAIKDEQVVDFIENKNNKEKMFKNLPLQIKMYNYVD